MRRGAGTGGWVPGPRVCGLWAQAQAGRHAASPCTVLIKGRLMPSCRGAAQGQHDHQGVRLAAAHTCRWQLHTTHLLMGAQVGGRLRQPLPLSEGEHRPLAAWIPPACTLMHTHAHRLCRQVAAAAAAAGVVLPRRAPPALAAHSHASPPKHVAWHSTAPQRAPWLAELLWAPTCPAPSPRDPLAACAPSR